jgi:glycerate-2-kinase
MGLGIRYKIKDIEGNHIVEEIHKVTVHSFTIGDVDDPEIYASQPIWEWQQSDAGKFVMEHAIDVPSYHRQMDQTIYGYRYAITAELEKKKLSEFYLRFGKNGSNTLQR